MNTVYGDLIKLAEDGEFDVIIHGCNCFCKMGAGVAKAIRSSFPEAVVADLETAKGDRAKLGSISVVDVHRAGRTITVVNGYTQFHWAGPGRLVDYDAVKSVMCKVKAGFSGKRIGYPRIGAGLARGNWEVIEKIIDKELKGEDHTLVEYSP
ncbi:MAG: macro domain-containing protein [Candidatus Krumholzibacteria bacterium]|nr:macro domain-containing protein [Candidatus Krumholzibacteria bacterium]